jgi:hypothetical protein
MKPGSLEGAPISKYWGRSPQYSLILPLKTPRFHCPTRACFIPWIYTEPNDYMHACTHVCAHTRVAYGRSRSYPLFLKPTCMQHMCTQCQPFAFPSRSLKLVVQEIRSTAKIKILGCTKAKALISDCNQFSNDLTKLLMFVSY